MNATLRKFFNYQIFRILGIGCVNSKNEPTSIYQTIYNFTVYAIYISLLVYGLKSAHPEDIFGVRSYSFISQIKYVIHLFGSPIFLLLIIIYQSKSKKSQSKILKIFFKEYNHLIELGITSPSPKLSSLASQSILIILAGICLFFIDYCRAYRKLPFSLWYALYFPGVVINTYFLAYSVYLILYKKLLEIINAKLEQYTHKEMSCIELFNLRKNNVRPVELLKRFPNSQLNFIDEVLMIHQKVCHAVECIKKAYGIPILIFFFITCMSGISLFYQTLMDFQVSSRDLDITIPNIRACDLWSFINAISLTTTSFCAFEIADEGNRTLELIHKLINIYPDMEEFGEIYCLQFEHQNTYMTAADFFTIRRRILYTLFIVSTTYLIILIQFNEMP